MGLRCGGKPGHGVVTAQIRGRRRRLVVRAERVSGLASGVGVFGEGVGSVLRVAGGQDGGDDLILLGEGVPIVAGGPLAGRAFDGRDGQWGVAGDAVDQFQGLAERLAGWGEVVDQAELLGSRSGEGLAAEEDSMAMLRGTRSGRRTMPPSGGTRA